MLLKNFFFSGVVLQFLLKARQKRQKKRRKTEEKTTTPNEQTVCCSNAINCTLERTNIKDLSMFIKLYIFCLFVSMQCDSCFFSQLFFPTRLLPLLCFVSLFSTIYSIASRESSLSCLCTKCINVWFST